MRRPNITLLAFFALCLAFCSTASAAELKSKTTTAFDKYVSATEARFAKELQPGGAFLYIDGLNPHDKSKAYEQHKAG